MSQLLQQVLEKTLSQNANDQEEALQLLEQAATQDLPTFIKELSVAFRTQNYPQLVRQAAGLQLKNVLSSEDEQVRISHLQRWLSLSVDLRNHVKMEVLQTLGTEQYRPSIAAQCIAAIACAEVPAGQWNDCIALLTKCINNESELLRESALETLGYICQDIKPKVLESQANSILTAIVSGMRKEEASNHVRLAATNALLNALKFTNSNFNNKTERNFIMQVVCEATQSTDSAVKVASLKCMVKILTRYYQLMDGYMPELAQITLQAIKCKEDNICLQGIEFWSNVCEEEITLAHEAEEAAKNHRAPKQVSRHYAKDATEHICPLILDTLSKRGEGDNEVLAKAARGCLKLLSLCVGDSIIPYMSPLLENFTHSSWRDKKSAIIAVGMIVVGPAPSSLHPMLKKAFPLVVEAMRIAALKDIAGWCLENMLKICPELSCDDDLLGELAEFDAPPILGNPLAFAEIDKAFMFFHIKFFSRGEGELQLSNSYQNTFIKDEDGEEIVSFAMTPDVYHGLRNGSTMIVQIINSRSSHVDQAAISASFIEFENKDSSDFKDEIVSPCDALTFERVKSVFPLDEIGVPRLYARNTQGKPYIVAVSSKVGLITVTVQYVGPNQVVPGDASEYILLSR